MVYLLAAAALAAPIILVVQTIRGRVRVQSCCSVPVDQDLRMRSESQAPIAPALPGSAETLDRV